MPPSHNGIAPALRLTSTFSSNEEASEQGPLGAQVRLLAGAFKALLFCSIE